MPALALKTFLFSWTASLSSFATLESSAVIKELGFATLGQSALVKQYASATLFTSGGIVNQPAGTIIDPLGVIIEQGIIRLRWGKRPVIPKELLERQWD